MPRKTQRSPRALWLYAYVIKPPQPRKRFAKIRALIRAADHAAERAGRAWASALISGQKGGPVTHLLVVSDTRNRDEAANLTLEAANLALEEELHELDAAIYVTASVPVPEG